MKYSASASVLQGLLFKGDSPATVKSFVEENPDSIQASEHAYPILHCMIRYLQVDAVRLLLQACPEAANIPSEKKGGAYPIHVVVECLPQLSGAIDPDTYYEMMEEGGEDAIDEYAANAPDHSKEMIQLLLDVDSNALLKQDAQGNTPLHSIWKIHDYTVSKQKLSWLLERAPGVLKISNKQGELEGYPEAVEHQNDAGDYPIHVAALLPVSPPSQVKSIVDKYPSAVSQVNGQGFTPFQWAQKHKKNNKALLQLLTEEETANKEDDGPAKKRAKSGTAAEDPICLE